MVSCLDSASWLEMWLVVTRLFLWAGWHDWCQLTLGICSPCFFFYNSHHWSWEVWSVTDMAGWVIIVPILARSCKRNLQYSQLIWKSKMEPSVAIFWSFKLLLFKKNYNFNIGRMFIFYMISSKFGCKLFFMWGKNHVKTQKLFFQTTSFGTPFLG